jgi:hypothetical protein
VSSTPYDQQYTSASNNIDNSYARNTHVVTQVSPQPCIGPSQVRRRSSLVLVSDHLDHVVPLGLVVALDESVLNEVVTEFRVVPSREDGGLGLVVVVGQKLFVLFTLQVGGRVGDDSLGDQPIPHLDVAPRAPDLVLGLPVVVLHHHQHGLSVGRGLQDSVSDHPSLEVVVGPGVVDRVVEVLVVDGRHLLKQKVSGVGRLGLDDVLLLEVVSSRARGSDSHFISTRARISHYRTVFDSPQLVVVPSAPNVILADVQGLLSLGAGVRAQRANTGTGTSTDALPTGNGLVVERGSGSLDVSVSGSGGLGSLVGRVAVHGGGDGGGPGRVTRTKVRRVNSNSRLTRGDCFSVLTSAWQRSSTPRQFPWG